MRYLTNCVNSTAEKIGAMIETGKQIKQPTARKLIGTEEFHRWCREMGYTVGTNSFGGLHIRNDWHVRYFRGIYDGQKCVYIVHSAIEYIFI